MPHTPHLSCINACHECAVACEHCAASCLGEPHVAKMVDCIRTDLDCAALCRLAVELMARGSEFATQTCQLCAQACDRCAEICEQHTDEHCRACAAACRKCAAECRRMSGMEGISQSRGIAGP